MRIAAGFLVAAVTSIVAASRADAVPCLAGSSCTRIKVAIAGKTLKITDASIGDPKQGWGWNFIQVEAKRDEGMVYVSEWANGINEAGSVIAGKGCEVGPFFEDTSAGNPEDAWQSDMGPWDARCPLAGLRRMDINSGRGNDVVNVVLSPIPVKITGGPATT
ncbi:MAG TPA: hypothetical protein VIS07_04340 [Candidatus Binatia bacterium]